MNLPQAGESAEITALIRQDEAARVEALDPSRSIILDAPAGSGKTTVLTQRLLRLLCEVDEPEEIIAITFTRKAAGEMAERVFQALRGGAEADESPPGRVTRELARAVQARSRDRGWRLLDSPQRLRIQTIDSLNRWLAGQLPLGAGGAGELAVLEDPGSAYATAARRTLVDAQAMAALQADAELLFERLENDFGRCEALLADMLKARAHWLPHLLRAGGGDGSYLPSRVQEGLRAVVEASLAQARRRLPAPLWHEGLGIGAVAAANRRAAGHEAGRWCALEAGADADADLATTLGRWQALAEMALTQSGEWRKRLDVRGGFPAHDKVLKQRALQWLDDMAAVPGCQALLEELLRLPAPLLAAAEGAALCALARLLNLAAAELDVVFGELGRVDYAFIAASARAALGPEDAPTDLGLALDARIRHILVDEFQDTSIEQTALLAALTEGWQQGDGRTLFVVGDPMQSIYRFREAEVGLFISAREHGIGQVRLTRLSLRRNFRSAPVLVQWCNEVFGKCFPAADDARSGAVRHVASVAGRPATMTGQVQLHHTLPGDQAAEAERIAGLVQQLRTQRPQGSIAVLVTARAHAGPIVHALAARGIEVAGVDLVPLGEVPVVRDLAALTRALDHLGDRTAWLAVLRAPWCGLLLTELTRLAGDPGQTLWEALSSNSAPAGDAERRLQRVREALTPLMGLRGQWPLARLVESAWLRLNGPAACAGEQELLQARAFLDALAGWTQQPDWNGPQQLTQRLARLYARHEERPAAVQVMTIHRAKGLEFDAVILPGLGRRMGGEREPLLRWLDLPRSGGSDLLMAPVPPLASAEPSALNAFIKSLQALRLAHERVRLLYVAATRAREQLHLFAQLDPAGGVPPAGVPLASLWPALAGSFRELLAQGAPDAAAAQSQAQARPVVQPLYRLSLDFKPAAIESGAVVLGLPLAPWEPPGQALSLEAEQALPRLMERALRDVLRRQARTGRLVTDAAEALPALRERLQQLQCPAQDMDEAAAAAARLLAGCLADQRLRWLCGSGRSQVHAPLALTGLYEDQIASVRADLAFVMEGTRWLVDFALAADGVAPTPQGQLEAHRTRLLRYRSLAAQLDGLPARAAVYVPALAVFAELP